MSTAKTATKQRDAARSKQALLEAAAALFAERGYEGTSLRAVAERAGVDAALIARYYGHKEGLFRAVLDADIIEPAPQPERPRISAQDVPFASAEHVRLVLEHWSEHGVSSVVQGMFRTDLEPSMLASVRGHYEDRLQGRARSAAGRKQRELRADLAAVLLLGVGVARAAGSMPTLAGASEAELEKLLVPALEAVLRG